MTDEIKKENAVTIEVPEIDSWQEALQFILSGFGFLITNYKKTTVFIVVALVVIIYNAFTNFGMINDIVSKIGAIAQ